MQSEANISQHIQDSILNLCITDTSFMSLVRNLDMGDVFVSSIPKIIWRICCDYFDNFHTSPLDHFHDEVASWSASLTDENKRFLTDYIEKVQNVRPDKNYVIFRLNAFVRQRKLEKALLDAAEIVEQNYDRASEILYAALDSGIEEQEAGLDYLNDSTGLAHRGENVGHLMGTGIPSLDRLIGGLDRGRLLCIMGAFKGKKSWALIHFGKTAVLNGLSVLHISHELSKEEMEERYDMAFGSMVDGKEGPGKEPTNAGNYSDDWRVKSTVLEEGVIRREMLTRPTIYNIAAVKNVRRRVAGMRGKLRIKKFPAASCTMEELRAYIHYLENFKGFHPDVIINDYVEKMNLGTDGEIRHRINQAYLIHKRIADEMNVLVITASQVVRAAIRAPKIRKEHFSEDIQKAGNVDMALAVCQTDEDIKMDTGKIYVVANRSGAEDIWCQIGMNINIGQFALWSRPSWQSESNVEGVEKEEADAIEEWRGKSES